MGPRVAKLAKSCTNLDLVMANLLISSERAGKHANLSTLIEMSQKMRITFSKLLVMTHDPNKQPSEVSADDMLDIIEFNLTKSIAALGIM